MTNDPEKINVLLVDDDIELLQSTKILLEHYDYSVIAAKDGQDGLKLAHEQAPDIIISDINMPILDGFGFFIKLQSSEITKTIPFIFLTGRGEDSDRRQGMMLGADDYINKPFDPEDLLNVIKTRLNRHHDIEQKYASTVQLLRKNITYSLPHELRTPLTGILGYSELLIMDYETIPRAQILDFATEIINSGNRLHRVIENYLVYAQLELFANDEDEVKALRRHLVLADKVIEVYALQHAQNHKRTEDLNLNLESNLGLRISETNLGKIVTEIIGNCFKFSPANSPIQVNAFREQNTVVVKFSDKGRGMSRAEIDIIGAYMQFERGIYEQQGMGLGLPIVLKLVELHNGVASIESEPGIGTTVSLRFDMY